MNMTIFLFILYFIHYVKCKYIYTKSVIIKNKNVNKIEKYISSVEFLENYLKTVNATNIEFTPEIKTKHIIYPQSFKYTAIPKFKCMPNLLPKLNFTQTWNHKKNYYNGTISCDLININLNLHLKENVNNVEVIIDSEITRKNFFIPNMLLNCAIDDFVRIFMNNYYKQCK